MSWSILPTRTATACHHVRMSDLPLDSTLDQTLRVSIKRVADTVAAGNSAFFIDPDQAEQFIAEVTACADMLDEATDGARQAGALRPSPGGDLVTENAVGQARRMADFGWQAMATYQQQMRDTATALEVQLAAYRATEQGNTPGRA